MTMKKYTINRQNLNEILGELAALRLEPSKHYVIGYHADPYQPILEFKDAKHEMLWRVAVGYKYT